jgi:hypothetical protein
MAPRRNRAATSGISPLMTNLERVPGAGQLPGRFARGRRVWLAAGLVALMLAAASLPAQQPPGGRRTDDAKSSAAPLPKSTGAAMPSFRGVIRQIDGKSIRVALDDHRELDFKRTDKTKFFKNGAEVKIPDFQPGDRVSIECQEDKAAYLVAVNVYWEKSAETVKAEGGGDSVVDAWAESPSTQIKPAPAKPDADDPGPPQLRRGRPADPSRERAPELPEQPPQVAESKPPSPTREAPERSGRSAPLPSIDSDVDLPFGARQTDPLIRKAANAALDFTEGLPNYVCQEVVTRYESESRPADWRARDLVSMDVVYENGKEDYRNFAVNGKPAKHSPEESGAWSTGEFGTVLIDLFSPATATEFRFAKDSRVAGILAKEYSFSVAREHSHWTIRSGSQRYQPAYSGSVWVDPATARVLRIEMAAKAMPEAFPLDSVESATDYQFVRLGGTQQFLLPVHSEVLTCQRGTNICSKNAIDFRNYHKFEGKSNITFEDEKL